MKPLADAIAEVFRIARRDAQVAEYKGAEDYAARVCGLIANRGRSEVMAFIAKFDTGGELSPD